MKTTKDTKFKPGNPGRPKGAKNKVTKEVKERIEWVLNLLDDTLEDDLEALKSAERVRLWIDLQEYVRPKLQRMNLELNPSENSISKITFEVMPTAEAPKE